MRARVLWHGVRQPKSTLLSFWSEPWSLGALWPGTWETDSRVTSKCFVPSFSMEPSGFRGTPGVKEHVTMLLFMKTLCHKIHMELQLREAKARPRHTGSVIAHLHSHTRTEPASLTSGENSEIHLCYATVSRVCNICWACDNSRFRAEVFYTF